MEDDDARHRREEAERRAKRKAAKSGARSDAQREKDRKRKEHAQRILGKQAKAGSASKRHKGDKPPPPPPPGATPSKFQNLFTQRAQGFQIEFRFRNAPPRPPVGPCFVGHSLDGVLIERSRQYKALNAVEANYKWRLHSEPDLGVPLAPSAMDASSYKPPKQAQEDDENIMGGGSGSKKLHPDDEALLNWTGSLGDTAAEHLKRRQDQLRAAARLALADKSKGRIPNILLPANTDKLKSHTTATASVSSKKVFSRVLDETMQSWMKKTTYLSNDYTRKVHDFKSLASTKQQLAQDLEEKQQQMNLRRSAQAITNSFTAVNMPPKHPTKAHLRPKLSMPILPNVEHWGFSYTHVVIDKAPNNLDLNKNDLSKAFVANVETDQNQRLVCQMWVPPAPKSDSDSEKSDEESEAEDEKDKDPSIVKYRPVQQFDLDVVPLKEEDKPHAHFCLWVDPAKKVTAYLPLSSRVQLSTGRPVKRRTLRKVGRRPKGKADLEEIKERMAEVDYDIAKEVGRPTTTVDVAIDNAQAFMTSNENKDAGSDDFSDSDKDGVNKAAINDDDSSDDEDEATFGGLKTIVAEN